MMAARFRPGAISEPLACQRGFVAGEAGDVPTRLVEPRDDAVGDRVAYIRKDDRDRLRLPLDGSGRHGPVCQVATVPFVRMMSGCRPTNC